MKPVYQQPMDGQCMRASIASLFEIPMEAAPAVVCPGHTWDAERKAFLCTIPEHAYQAGPDRTRYHCDSSIEQDKRIQAWCDRYGLRFVQAWMEYGTREVGVRPHSGYKLLPPGLCIATGPSPRFDGNHAVVWDARLRDFEHPYGRMVHDPAPVPDGTRPGIRYVEQFMWFEVEDPSLLHRLHELPGA